MARRRNSMTFTMSRMKARTIAEPNTEAMMVAGRGAIRMPWVASVLKSVMSRMRLMGDVVLQNVGLRR